jgi:PAS domain S-box-containing protein
MKKDKDKPASTAAELRRLAEERLKSRKSEDRGQKSAADNQRLMHELQVHQIELEMQNEELFQSRTEAEVGLDSYTILYDFAPVGYFTLDRGGAICQANLTGARLLGVERARLVNRRFGLFVSEGDRSLFNAFLKKAFESKGKEVFEVALLKEGAGPLWVQIEALASEDRQECRAVLVDITERKQAEEALRHVLRSARCILWHAVVTDRVEGGFQWDVRITNEAAAEKMFPLPRKPGQRYSDVWRHGTPWEDIERMERSSMQAIREGKTGYVHEFRLCLSSGEIRWLSEDAHVQPIEPRRWLVVGVCTDVTDRKKADEAIKEQMNELRRWHEVTLGRETRILDLKREVNELLAQAGQPPRYESAVTDDGRSDRTEECGMRNAECGMMSSLGR